MSEPTKKPRAPRKPPGTRKSSDNARWPDRTRAKRQSDRRDKLHARALEVGYDTWYLAETAIIKGAIKLVKDDGVETKNLSANSL